MLLNKETLRFCVCVIVLSLSATAHGADVKFDESGLKINSDSGSASVAIGGRIHFDNLRSGDELFGDETEVRRLRLDMTTKLGDNVRVKLDREFAPRRSGWRNAWIELRQNNIRLKLGQFVSPVSTEDLMESNDLAFPDRSLTASLSSGFRKGASLTYRGKEYSLIGAVMTNPISDSSRRDDGTSIIARGIAYPIRSSDEVLHFAVSAERRQLKNDAFSDIRSGHEISLRQQRFLETDKIENADNYTTLNAETAYYKGQTLFQSQISHRQLSVEGKNQTARAGYIQASYLFGEARRRYSRTSGAFGAIEPKSKSGAFEISARLSELKIANVGSEKALSAAASWYLTKNLRLTSALTHNSITENIQPKKLRGTSLQSRFQVRF